MIKHNKKIGVCCYLIHFIYHNYLPASNLRLAKKKTFLAQLTSGTYLRRKQKHSRASKYSVQKSRKWPSVCDGAAVSPISGSLASVVQSMGMAEAPGVLRYARTELTYPILHRSRAGSINALMFPRRWLDWPRIRRERNRIRFWS
jgi:hypothetical protein